MEKVAMKLSFLSCDVSVSYHMDLYQTLIKPLIKCAEHVVK